MKKHELLKLLANVPDDANLFFVSSTFEINDDMSLAEENFSDVKEVFPDGDTDAYVVMTSKWFEN